MRTGLACALVLFSAGCGLTLDLDPPDQPVDAGTWDAGAPSRCGDGVATPPEECDDGNALGGDGCEPVTCQRTCDGDDECVISDQACAAARCTSAHRCEIVTAADHSSCADGDGKCVSGVCIPATCGNGEVDGDEECDDGNHDVDDGCQPDCTLICHQDADCDDGVECNGAEICVMGMNSDGVRTATCDRGQAPELPRGCICDIEAGMLRHADEDGDGYGSAEAACPEPGSDCDDTRADVHPGAPDFHGADEIDNDCDGENGEDRVARCLRDDDLDGFGVPDPMVPVTAAECPEDTLPAPSDASFLLDCDDTNPQVFPGQTEFFAEPRPGCTSGPCWDYNCDGANEQLWPRQAHCLKLLSECRGHGWQLGVPGCGEAAPWTQCANLLLACTPGLLSVSRQQLCR